MGAHALAYGQGLNPIAITVRCTVNALAKSDEVDEAWMIVQDLVKDEPMKHHMGTADMEAIACGAPMVYVNVRENFHTGNAHSSQHMRSTSTRRRMLVLTTDTVPRPIGIC